MPSHRCLEFILNSEIRQLTVAPRATGSTGICELLYVKAAGRKDFAQSPYLGSVVFPERTAISFMTKESRWSHANGSSSVTAASVLIF